MTKPQPVILLPPSEAKAPGGHRVDPEGPDLTGSEATAVLRAAP